MKKEIDKKITISELLPNINMWLVGMDINYSISDNNYSKKSKNINFRLDERSMRFGYGDVLLIITEPTKDTFLKLEVFVNGHFEKSISAETFTKTVFMNQIGIFLMDALYLRDNNRFVSWWDRYVQNWMKSEKMTMDEIKREIEYNWNCSSYKEVIYLMAEALKRYDSNFEKFVKEIKKNEY